MVKSSHTRICARFPNLFSGGKPLVGKGREQSSLHRTALDKYSYYKQGI